MKKLHYTQVLEDITNHIQECCILNSSIDDFLSNETLSTFKSSYLYDCKNSESIDDFIRNLSKQTRFIVSKKGENLLHAVIARIIGIRYLFENNRLTPYVTVPDNIDETLCVILIEFWEDLRPVLETEI